MISENAGGPRYATDPFRYEHLVSLHGDPSIEESLLFRPLDLTIGDDGFYYVNDTGNHRIAVFNSVGEYVHSFGREGSGPGEFRGMQIQSLHNSTLSLFDGSQQRATLYQTDGTLIEVVRLTRGGRVRGLERTPDGTIIARSIHSVERDNIWYETLIITHLAGNGQDTLYTWMGEEVPTNSHVYIGMREGKPSYMSGPMPYRARPSAVYVPERGILLTEGTKPLLQWFDLSGALVHEIRLGLPVLLVTEAMKRARSRSIKVRVATVEPKWEFPETVGLWDEAIVDDSGFIWLKAVRTYNGEYNLYRTRMHVVAPNGEYLGITELPIRVMGIAHGQVLGHLRDEETGETVPAAFLVVPAVEGLKYPE